ncbi:MAG TPA: FAD-binding oxidoreductase [Vicinamibacterales bacterium]|jgi:sarcosine oxidase subunit beta|nr:FAD-binding oxidoreductase [Vicinamibacterales bacterium]
MKRSADVVVIGGGCMGASVAYHLTRRGITDLVVLEREKLLATGSTGRNAGGVRHQFSNEANIRLSMESIGLLERFADEVGHPIDFHQDGYLFLLSSPQSVETFRRNVALQRSLGVDVDWLDASEAERLAPGIDASGVLGATFCARDGIADPNGVTLGFAKAAQAAGAAVERGVEVTSIHVEHGRVCAVETNQGTIATRTVVNAAGPWARQIGRMVGSPSPANLEIPVDPIRRHIFIAALDGKGATDRAAGVPASHVMVIDFETTFYFHREGAGILLGMGDPRETPGFDTTVQWDFLPQVIEVAVTRLPALATASISHAWAGLYEMSPDGNPIIGPTSVEGFYLINGFSGHGFQHSPAAGRILADVIAGNDPGIDLAPFALARFSAQPVAPASGGHGGQQGERYVV